MCKDEIGDEHPRCGTPISHTIRLGPLPTDPGIRQPAPDRCGRPPNPVRLVAHQSPNPASAAPGTGRGRGHEAGHRQSAPPARRRRRSSKSSAPPAMAATGYPKRQPASALVVIPPSPSPPKGPHE